MLKKISIALSVVGALGLAVAVSADAQPVKKKTVTVHRNVTVHRTVTTRNRYVVGRRYNGHVWYGRNRHFWHGRWYGYGVGPCWINVGGLWFWNVAACP